MNRSGFPTGNFQVCSDSQTLDKTEALKCTPPSVAMAVSVWRVTGMPEMTIDVSGAKRRDPAVTHSSPGVPLIF